MKVRACLVSGLEIVGFQIEGNKGELKTYTYQSAIMQANLKRIEGVTCQTINGKKILVGIDYQHIKKIPVQFINSYRTCTTDGEVKYYIKSEGLESEQEVNISDFWSACVCHKVKEPDCGIVTDGNNLFKYIRFGENTDVVGDIEKEESEYIVEQKESLEEQKVGSGKTAKEGTEEVVKKDKEEGIKKKGRQSKVKEEEVVKQESETAVKKRGRPAKAKTEEAKKSETKKVSTKKTVTGVTGVKGGRAKKG